MNPMTTTGPGPFLVVDSPHETARWRPLVNWVLYIPHAVILYALQALSRAVFLVYWLVLVFTGRLQPGLCGIMGMYDRYNTRACGFLVGYEAIVVGYFMRGAGSRRTRCGVENGARRSRKSSISSTGELRKKAAIGVSIQMRSANR